MDRDHVVALARSVDPALGDRISFLLEVDGLKNVIRRSRLVDRSRLENTAEHSWHLAMVALVLAPHAGPDVDLTRAVAMVVIHDLVEIDAGDTFAYDTAGHEDKAEREAAAADRIFGLLPVDEGLDLRALWDEYEQRRTPSAVFAYACDRLQPMLLNASSGGRSWKEHGIQQSQVKQFNAPVGHAADEFWALALAVIADAVEHGQLGAD